MKTLEISAHASITPTQSTSDVQSQVDVAKRYPRDVAAARQRAVQMATLDLDIAAGCIYRRPVGKDKNGIEIYAEGPSIRMAEIIASAWGNLRAATSIDHIGEREVVASAMAWDLESNVAIKTETRESCVDRDGRPYPERLRLVVAKAAAKKALRDAIFGVVPKAITQSVLAACQETLKAAGQKRADKRRIEKAKAWLARIGVTEARAFHVLGIRSWDEATEEVLSRLGAIAQAIANEETTPELAFPDVDTAAETESNPAPPPQEPANANQEQDNMTAAKVKLIRSMLKKNKVDESKWIKAAVEAGVLTTEMPLEQAVKSFWRELSDNAARINQLCGILL